MTVKDLQEFYVYGCWANRRLEPILQTLTPEEFAQTVGEGSVSVQSVWVHMVSAEAGWLERCGGPERGPALRPADFPTPQSVWEAGRTFETKMQTFLAGLQEADLERMQEYTLGSQQQVTMPVGELLHHAFNHGVHHRGQLALLLQQLGKDPGNFDSLIYFAEKRGIRIG